MTLEFPYIVADIGGTNSRFGLVTSTFTSASQPQIENKQKFLSSRFNSLEEATRYYIKTLDIDTDQLSGACLAVAGPITGDDVSLTNLGWSFSIKGMKQSLGLAKLQVINDFTAYAIATQFVAPANLITINQGKRIEQCPMSIVGPGTGFGVAALISDNEQLRVISTEGGHMTLSSKNSLQAAVIEELSKQIKHVSIETVLSGPGLSNLYRALAKIEALPSSNLQASEISKQAKEDKNSLSYRTLSLFCKWLGQVTADLALAQGARSGIYLCGGILKQNTDFFLKSEFLSGFLDKGPMENYVKDIPIQLVIENDSALLGAAASFNLE